MPLPRVVSPCGHYPLAGDSVHVGCVTFAGVHLRRRTFRNASPGSGSGGRWPCSGRWCGSPRPSGAARVRTAGGEIPDLPGHRPQLIDQRPDVQEGQRRAFLADVGHRSGRRSPARPPRGSPSSSSRTAAARPARRSGPSGRRCRPAGSAASRPAEQAGDVVGGQPAVPAQHHVELVLPARQLGHHRHPERRQPVTRDGHVRRPALHRDGVRGERRQLGQQLTAAGVEIKQALRGPQQGPGQPGVGPGGVGAGRAAVQPGELPPVIGTPAASPTSWSYSRVDCISRP